MIFCSGEFFADGVKKNNNPLAKLLTKCYLINSPDYADIDRSAV